MDLVIYIYQYAGVHFFLFISCIIGILCLWRFAVVVTMVQVQIGTHSFTFDHVYGSSASPSSKMFEECVAPLVDGLFQGYNATVLAYGQVKCYCLSYSKTNQVNQKKCSWCHIFHLVFDISMCCRQVLGKHIPWEQALEMVAKQD